ncbi:hypothetical protein [Streptomyces sp. NPDC016845]|uniref:hypothetical protein n=1 Tax=Streptomyces sp. NPDC016845 TaxID=3364972 RepID=UPI00379C184B
MGFPDAERTEGALRDTKEINGTIETLTGYRAGSLAIHVKDSAAPKDSVRGTSWTGASGAAVFCEPWLVGVLTTAPHDRYASDALRAEPVARSAALLRAAGLRPTSRRITAGRVRWARRWWLVWAGAVVAAVIVAGALSVGGAQSPPLFRLRQLPNVAVAGLVSQDRTQQREVLEDVSVGLADELATALPGVEVHNYASEHRLRLGELAEPAHRGLDTKTADFLRRTNAAVVVGALVRTNSGGQTEVRPALHVRADQVVDAPELSGWYLGEPLVTDVGWQSASGRRSVVDRLVARVQRLTVFVSSLDLWRRGRTTEAEKGLHKLVSSEQGANTGGDFVGPDLVRLFHGHTLVQQVLEGPSDSWSSGLRAAEADYRTITRGSTLHRRALLSLANASYLRAVGPAPTCRSGDVSAAGLADAASMLRKLKDDAAFTDIGRLKAAVNLAQVEQCRITAGLVPDDSRVVQLTERVRESHEVAGGQQLRALAASVAATNAAHRGDLRGAIRTIEEAIALESRFVTRALWKGLLAAWSYRACDLSAGDRARRESLSQLEAGVADGQIPLPRLNNYRETLEAAHAKAVQQCISKG